MESIVSWRSRGSVSESSRPPPAPRKKHDVPLFKSSPRDSLTISARARAMLFSATSKPFGDSLRVVRQLRNAKNHNRIN